MKILSIKTNGFRKFEDEFSSNFFEDTTYIFGGNHKGKTNILFAIVWAILGTNLTGDDRVCFANKNKDDYFVELKIKDNQDNIHTILRYKNKIDSGKNALFLDGKVAKQEDLVNFYNNKGLFLSVINLSYFVGLQPAKQKELIDKYLPNVDINDVYNKLSAEDKKLLTSVPMNAKLHISELDDELKRLNSKITNYQGKIDYAYDIAHQEITPPHLFIKQEELDFAYQELDLLKSEKNIVDRDVLQKKLLELQKEEFELNTEISKLDTILSNGKTKYYEIQKGYQNTCPTCKQLLNDKSKVETTKHLRAELIELNDKRTKLKGKYDTVHFDRVACEGKIYSLDNTSNSNISLDKLNSLEQNIKLLEQEKLENTKLQTSYSINLKNKEKATSDIEHFKKEISLIEKIIEEVKQEIEITKKLYFNLVKAKMEVADSYLKDVKIRFYKVIKATGELKDDFVITYKDKDYSTLSRSEKIATSLEIANMLNKITGLNSPLFIDDSESYPDFNFVDEYSDSQIFIAQVKKGRNLKITNKKETITGFSINHFAQPEKMGCVA